MNFSKLTKQQQETLMSSTGVLIVLGIVLVVNLFVNQIPLRFDLTEYKIYTLSKGTKNIVRNLEAPVKIQYFVTDSREMMSAEERNFARRIENMLIEYEKLNRNVILEKLDPEPDTDAEDAAVLAGLQTAMGSRGEIYMGIVVKCLDKEEIIPFVMPDREQLLEYDVTSAISRVSAEDKPKVVVMTSVSVSGGFSGNFQAPPEEPWYFYEELGRDYEVEVIEADAKEVPEGTDVLIVFHPYDISEAGEYAIDQYLMTGGNVMVLVDPMFWASRALTPQQNPMMQGMPPQGPGQSSDLPTLFEAWGVDYNATQVLADQTFALQVERDRFATSVASLSESAMNRENIVTSQLNDVLLPLPGGFTVEPKEGISLEPLLLSSPNNSFVSSFESEPGEALWKFQEEFVPAGKPRLYAFQLTGKFKSAFPNGNPAGEDSAEDSAEADADADAAEEDKAETAEAEEEKAEGEEAKEEETESKDEDKAKDKKDSGSLKEAKEAGSVLVIGDADFIFREFALEIFRLGNQRFAQPRNQNLSLFLSTTEFMAGNDDLISLRSRASTRREFTKLNDMRAEAQSQMRERLLALQKQQQELQEEIEQALSAQAESGQQEIIIDTGAFDIDALRRQEVETSREIRELQKQLKARVDRYINGVKFWNIVPVPLIVIAIGLILYGYRQGRVAAK